MIDEFDTPDEATQSRDFDVRIASLPKVELHIHLEGAIRRQTYRNSLAGKTPIRLSTSYLGHVATFSITAGPTLPTL